jgi:hypothetical protein
MGFARLWHTPKGMTFTMGTWSMMLAAGTLLDMIILTGSTISELGAAPKEHCNKAPMHTCFAILLLR